MQRIETSTGEGVPDLWVGWETGYSWVELKHTKEWPVRATSKVFGSHGLRVEQIAWHVAAAQRGVHAAILAAVGKGTTRQSFLVPSTEAERFNDMTKAELMVWHTPIDNIPSVLKVAGKVWVPPTQ